MSYYNNEFKYDPIDSDYQEIDRVNAEAREFEQQKLEQEELERKEQEEAERAQAEKEAEEPFYDENPTIATAQKLAEGATQNPLTAIPAAMGAGVVDTVMDIGGLVPWLKPADDWYDERFGRQRDKNPWTRTMRDISGIVIPSLTGGGAIAKGLQGATKGMAISNRTRTLGKIAAEIGVGAGIEAASEQTVEPGNVGTVLEEAFGVQVPWATRDGDTPDKIYQKNMLESVALAGFGGVVEAALSIRGGNKLIAKNEAAKKAIEAKEAAESKALKAAGGDVVTAKVETDNAVRVAGQTKEAIKRLEADPEGVKGYDAFINEPHEPQARVVMNDGADPIDFKADQARIGTNTGTVNGRARPAVTDHFKEDFMKAPDGTERGEMLGSLAKDLEPSFEVIIGDRKISAEEVAKSVDDFASAAMSLDLPEFTKMVNALKGGADNIAGNRNNFLSSDAFQTATKAFQKAFETLDPEKLRASGVMTGQIGGDVADISRGIGLMGDTLDTTRQQELVWNNLKVLLPEIRAVQYLNGWRLQAMNLDKKMRSAAKSGKNAADVKAQNEIYASWMAENDAKFDVELKQAKEKSLEFINTLVDISKEKPEFFKPLYREFVKTNGKVDDIDKLMRLAENRIGFIKKAFVDGNPEMPSMLVQELQGVRYNNILTGLAPVRALGGAAIGLVGKPITTLVGSRIAGDSDAFKRALFTFGGVQENIQRGLKVMQEEWKFAVENPRASMARGREDLDIKSMQDWETMEEMAEIWRNSGQKGKAAMWDLTKTFYAFNNSFIPRLGINSMYAIDGFVKSMSASMSARARAYDELFDVANGAIDEDAFKNLQQKLYDQAFDKNGVLTDEAAKYASGEINLNLDNKLVSGLEGVMRQFPIMKSIFMFPRTGVNALNLASTFNPLGPLGLAVGKARKVLNAASKAEIDEVLADHGLSGQGMAAFNALKGEYIGRQAMGSAITTGALMMAFNGNLTGNGPQDDAEKRRMIAMGWKPLSIKDPISGEWRSYQGFEPFDTFLGLAGDMAYQLQRVDQSITEDWFRALSASISYNITNKSFLSGFEPLSGLLSGDVGAMNRWFAMMADSTIPLTGVRSILNKAISPGLKEVENNWWNYLANRNKWLPPVNNELHNMLDVYTGEQIKYFEPITAGINSLLPFFKTNGGMEEWRQKLLASGWDGLQRPRTNPTTGEIVKPEEIFFINNWIAQNYNLGERVEETLNKFENMGEAEMKRYAKARGFKTQREFPIKKTLLHRDLTKLHNDAYKLAWRAYEEENIERANGKHLQDIAEQQLSAGQYEQAQSTADQAKELMNHPLSQMK